MTVSGVSSGGSMAMIHTIARSSCVTGVGVVAGSTYGCNAMLSACPEACGYGDCDCQHKHQSLVDRYLQQRASAGEIDALSNIKGLKAWLFSGSADQIVSPCVMAAVQHQLTALGANVQGVFTVPAAHGWVVDGRDFPYPGSYPPCGSHGPDYVEDCQYDMSMQLLTHLYGSLKPMKTYSSALFANLVHVNQAAYVPSGSSAASIGMATGALAYVPTGCKSNVAACAVHVHYHGCGGGGITQPRNGHQIFWKETPYIAEANDIVVLYPQTVAASNWRSVNPDGCWDWKGYYSDPRFDTTEGAQLHTVLAMVDDLPNAVRKAASVLGNVTADTVFGELWKWNFTDYTKFA